MSEGDVIEVFICDDSSSLRTLVGLQLDGDPRTALVGGCGDPSECLRRVAAAPPDVVLLDHGIVPRRDPRDFLSALRLAAPDALLVLFSGHPAEPLEKQARALGADAAISKDVSGAELAEVLAGLVRTGAKTS